MMKIILIIFALLIPSISMARNDDLCIKLLEENSQLYETLYEKQTTLSNEITNVRWITKKEKDDIANRLLRTESEYNKTLIEIKTRKSNAVWTGDVVECAPILDQKQNTIKKQLNDTNVEIASLKSTVSQFGLDSINPICAKNSNCVNIARDYYFNNRTNQYDLPKMLTLIDALVKGFDKKVVTIKSSDDEALSCKKSILNMYPNIISISKNAGNLLKLIETLTWLPSELKSSIKADVQNWLKLNDDIIVLTANIKDGSMNTDVSYICYELFTNLNPVLSEKSQVYLNTVNYLNEKLSKINTDEKSCTDITSCNKKFVAEFIKNQNLSNSKFLGSVSIELSEINKIIGSTYKK